MESIKIVFNAAKDGNLSKLKSFLDNKPKEEVLPLVSSCTNGTTPLIIACRNGHADVVEYLIDKCNADIEQFGNVQFEGEPIGESAPPLCCAAAMGHFDVVKLLVRHKASVNRTTKGNLTPLRAACFRGFLKIVKYLIQHGADTEITDCRGRTCLMLAFKKGHLEISEYLIRNGADVNKKCSDGKTALHDCAVSGNLKTFKLLLQHGAKYECDSFGITPLVTAALYDQKAIFEYLFHEFGCTKLDKVHALEVLGATFTREIDDVIKGLDFWRRALDLRYEDAENLLLKPITQLPIASYINQSEFRTVLELEEIRYNYEEMLVQAILVLARIIGPSHDKIVFSIIKLGTLYAKHHNDLDRCFQMWLYVLDVQQNEREPQSPTIHRSFQCLGNLVSRWIRIQAFGHALPFLHIVGVFERAVKEIQRVMELLEKEDQDVPYMMIRDLPYIIYNFNSFLKFAVRFIGIMCVLEPRLNKSEKLELKKSVYKLVRMNPKDSEGKTLLHLACFVTSGNFVRPVMPFPSPKVVDLLLEVGACPNAVDADYNTPLHISAIAMNKEFAPAVFKSFLKHGAHLDVSNYQKLTPLQLAQDIPLLGIYPLQHINLQCLCAQAIQNNNISYKEFVHKELEAFLDVH